jgi:hypothetical protein
MAYKRRVEISSESMVLSTVAALGLISVVGFLWRIGLPFWMIGVLAFIVVVLLNHALDLRLRMVETRRRAARRIPEHK